MSAKLAKRLNAREATHEQLIILVHGIRTFANWQQMLKAEFQNAGLKVESTNFDFFDLIRFLVPLKYFRRKKIDQVLKQLRQARGLHPDAKISVLAHSFGSYIVAEILAAEPDIIIHRLVLCGSIVPSDHPFVQQLGPRIRTHVVNDVGSRDIWPALANSITTGYGHTGTYGFRVPGVEDRWFKGFKHSDFLTPDFCRKYWVPFFKEGVVSTDATRCIDSPPLWLQAASVPVLKIKVVVPFLVLGTLIWWKWNYLTQLLKLN
jgi:pimeloyl-ACP methyl ester carboxylesterase